MQEYPSIQCYSSYGIVFHHRFGDGHDRVRPSIREKYLQSQLAQMVADSTQFGSIRMIRSWTTATWSPAERVLLLDFHPGKFPPFGAQLVAQPVDSPFFLA